MNSSSKSKPVNLTRLKYWRKSRNSSPTMPGNDRKRPRKAKENGNSGLERNAPGQSSTGKTVKKLKVDHYFTSSDKVSCKKTRSCSSSGVCDRTKQKLMNFALSDSSSLLDNPETNYKKFKLVNEDRVSSSSDIASKFMNETSCKSENTKVKYTPLEEQYLNLKSQYSDTILFIQHGYRYRFFGNDAEIAVAEFNIFGHVDHNFMTANIPVHRVHVYIKCLVAKGYKVGIVKETETAARRSDNANKSSLFERKLTALYTKSTLVGEDLQSFLDDSVESDVGNVTNHLACICEQNVDEKHLEIGFLAVEPSTCDIIYDVFIDGPSRFELEQRLLYIQPSEIIIPETLLSNATVDLIDSHLLERKFKTDYIRMERVQDKEFDYSAALISLATFLVTKEKENEANDMDKVLTLPKVIIQCYAALMNHLKAYNFEKFLKYSKISKFNEENSKMILNGTTAKNLEIFYSTFSKNASGSLWGVINKTKTKFGARLLKKWLCHPLRVKNEIEKRQEMVSEIIHSGSHIITVVSDIRKSIPDLERLVSSVLHLKCGTREFYLFISALHRIHDQLNSVQHGLDSEIKCSHLKYVIKEIIDDLTDIPNVRLKINEIAARDGNKCDLFKDISMFSAMSKTKKNIDATITKLNNLKTIIGKTVHIPDFQFTSVSGQNFLIEVKNSHAKLVPNDWMMIAATKQVKRYRSIDVQNLVNELNRYQDELIINAEEAWLLFLRQFSKNHMKLKNIVKNLAILDCLYSLADVAKQYDYCRPTLNDCRGPLVIKNGRNPIVVKALDDPMQFISNSTHLSQNDLTCLIITGPNMGGKSCYVRQVALICVLAQIGSFVPAESAELPILDGIYTRMGANDNIYENRSTFMSEMLETNEIMKNASANSLVIIDELGRGTSTHDGAALAYASLHYFLEEIKCYTMFVTHYSVVTELETSLKKCRNYHMAYMIAETSCDEEHDAVAVDATQYITFLYRVSKGRAPSSYGLNVARMAGIPSSILSEATTKSYNLQKESSTFRSDVLKFLHYWKNNGGDYLSAVESFVGGVR